MPGSMEALQALAQANYGLDVNGAARVASGLDLDLNGVAYALYGTEWYAAFDQLVDLLGGPWELVLDGSVGANASTPDKPAFTFTNLDIRILLTNNDWTPGGFGKRLVDHDGGSGNASWSVQIAAAGEPALVFSQNGSTTVTRTATTVTGFTDSTEHWMRYTLLANNGASGHDATFQTSSDGGQTWDPIGTNPVTTAGTIALFNSTAPIRIGGRVLEPNARIDYVEIRDDINGTIVANPDFRTVPAGTTSFTDGAGNTWTLNGAAVVQ
jgi:hypothetical protein